MAKIIPRYIRKEVLPPLALSLSVFTLVLFMQNALELSNLIISRGVAPTQVAKIILYTLPSILWLTIPMAVLTANLTALGRLSADNEVIAMNSLGIGLGNFVRPVFQVGVVLFIVTFLIGAFVVPWGRSSLNLLIYRIFRENATAGIEAKVFNDTFSDLVIYTNKVDPKKNTLHDIMIADYRSDPPETIYARTGIIRSAKKTLSHSLTLIDGSVHQYDAKNGRYRLISFQQYQLSLTTNVSPIVYSLSLSEKNPKEMRLSELRELSKTAPPAEATVFQLHYYERFALPFSCVIFGLLAVPLGIRFRRSGKLIGFSWSLLIVFLYYLILGAGRHFASESLFPPILAAWLPNIAFGATGLYLLMNVSRKIPTEGGGLYGIQKLRERFRRQRQLSRGGTGPR
jgi:lipopolysaccharide export system permease protein